MRFIGNITALKKDPVAYRIYDKLNTILQDGDDSLLYYMFPVYSGNIDMGKVQANLMLLSLDYGVYYFDSMHYGETLEEAEERINTLYSYITDSFRKIPALKKRRDTLKYDVLTVFVSDDTSKIELSDDFILSDFNSLKEVLDENQEEIDNKSFDLMQSCLDGTPQMIKKTVRSSSSVRETKGMILDEIESNIAKFDIEQKEAAFAEIDGPQRIRGLAGSGKTIVLTQKAAIYHLKHPNETILYTYYTKALHDTIKEHIGRAYKYFSDNKEPNWDKIIICHAWGSSYTPGVYSMACEKCGAVPLNYGQAMRIACNDPFGTVCNQLLGEYKIAPQYDLILIDEGQDFTPPFYQLCYQLSKTRKIAWAYDDFQNIFNVKIQDERATFGTNNRGEFNVDFSRDDMVNQDIVLKKCYRTPRYSLISAFSLGLGIYNNKVLQRLDNNEHWESLGFHVLRGGCVTGDDMIIERPEENTPGYSNKKFNEDSIKYQAFGNFDEECKFIAKSITNDLANENLRPEDICVICVDLKSVKGYFSNISGYLWNNQINTFNLIATASDNLSFTKAGCITLATVNKAKGNEKGVVYICGVDYIFSRPNNVVLRDILFTAMTRTKGWLTITGCTKDFKQCLAETKSLKDNAYNLCFKQPSESETKTIESHSRVQNAIYDNWGKDIETLKKTGQSTEEILKEIQRILKNDRQ